MKRVNSFQRWVQRLTGPITMHCPVSLLLLVISLLLIHRGCLFRNHGMHHLVNYIQRSDHASLLILCYVEIKPAHWHTGTSRCDAFYFNAWSLLMYSDHACIAEHVFYWLCILYLETRQCTSVQIKLIRVLLTFYLEIKPCIGYRSCVLLATYCITTDQTMNFVCDAGIRLCTEIKVHPVTWWRYISVHGLISLCSQFYSCAMICYSLIDACFIHGSKPKLSLKHVLWSDHGNKMLCLEIRRCFEIRFSMQSDWGFLVWYLLYKHQQCQNWEAGSGECMCVFNEHAALHHTPPSLLHPWGV